MSEEEIKQAQEQLARLFGDYMKLVFENGKNKDLNFVEFIEKPVYLAAMRYCGGNKSKAVKYLRCDEKTLSKRLMRHFNTRAVGTTFDEVK